jgi:hypothetical protein
MSVSVPVSCKKPKLSLLIQYVIDRSACVHNQLLLLLLSMMVLLLLLDRGRLETARERCWR